MCARCVCACMRVCVRMHVCVHVCCMCLILSSPGLLTVDSTQRLTLPQLLSHPWMVSGHANPGTPLATPTALNSGDSTEVCNVGNGLADDIGGSMVMLQCKDYTHPHPLPLPLSLSLSLLFSFSLCLPLSPLCLPLPLSLTECCECHIQSVLHVHCSKGSLLLARCLQCSSSKEEKGEQVSCQASPHGGRGPANGV